ncbi:MAG: sigma-54-dependent Fis family transcriptional regulator [Prevotellaceae bacterium]|nr:sigma-54-dependent Fis family transcriptional regulator [Candidatus Minthosoma caballi]
MDERKIMQVKQRYGIVGNCEGLNHALDIAVQVAPTDVSVLIVGESGVGKEAIPRVIHDNSARKHNKYFAINCGSLPDGTIDSELFGHRKGSFTGAVDDREGYFGVANNGTLFLDEVGELPLATQARLLRVLETGEYIRVGESEIRKTNVRIVAATNVNLQKAIKEGKFREDLYYRLNTISITVPPLRERGKDIERIFKKFAIDIADKYSFEPIRLTPDACELIQKYKWPGNIRQLRNITEQLSIISEEREISADTLMKYGITDDTKGEPGLVLHSGARDRQSDAEVHTYESERDLLFMMLSKIGNEVKGLKEFIQSNLETQNRGTDIYTVFNEDNMPIQKPVYNQPIYPSGVSVINDHEYQQSQNMPPVEVEVVNETPLSNKELMKKNIIEALRRNKGNRKKAALELGISDRTLYRKIKSYDLDL